jgi:hypothetical protein
MWYVDPVELITRATTAPYGAASAGTSGLRLNTRKPAGTGNVPLRRRASRFGRVVVMGARVDIADPGVVLATVMEVSVVTVVIVPKLAAPADLRAFEHAARATSAITVTSTGRSSRTEKRGYAGRTTES